MKKTLALAVSVALTTLAFTATPALAGEPTNRFGRLQLTPTGMLLADNVVITPGAEGAQAAPAQQAVPAQAPPVQAAAPAQSTNKVVHTDVKPSGNYMGTIAVSALMGGLVGALVGGSIYFLDDDRDNPENIAYWAAGGVLLGTGVGVVQIMVQEGRASNATALRKLPSDPAPTMRLALFRATF